MANTPNASTLQPTNVIPPHVATPGATHPATPPPAAVFTPGGVAFTPGARPMPAAAAPPAENTTLHNPATERERAYMRAKLVEVFQRGETGKLAAYILDLLRPDLAEELAQQIKANPAAVSALPEFLPIAADPRLPGFAFEFVTFFEESGDGAPAPENATLPVESVAAAT
jgi:hypothetical protein